MRYLGGKSKIRKQVAAVLESLRKPGQTYLEPFVGGGWVLQEMSGFRIAADVNEALITMYQALQHGWVPPDVVTEETFRRYKMTPGADDPMTAFCLIGCSFGGDWGKGYAGNGKKASAATTRRSLLAQLPRIQDALIVHRHYADWRPVDCLIYCDPPYAGTTSYGATGAFDHAAFWQVMREWRAAGNTVVMSEYQAPDDWACVAEFGSRMGLRTTNGQQEARVERLFI